MRRRLLLRFSGIVVREEWCGTLWRRRSASAARRSALLGAALMSALLGGCTLGPDFTPPEAPPVARYLPPRGPTDAPGLAFAHGADIPGRWWELFRSRALNDLIEEGIRHNPDLQAAEAAVRIAQANALAQRGALFPQVAGNWNSQRQKTPVATLDTQAASGAAIYSLHTAQVTVSYVADVWGATRRQFESLQATVENQAFQREGVYLTLTANIALAAIQEASLRGQIAATRRLIGLQRQLLDILRRQNAQGQIALPDVLAQETALAQSRLLLPALEKQLEQQRHLLAVLTGRFPGDGTAASFTLASLRMPRPVPLSLPADLVRQRPDVRAAEASVHAASAQVGVAVANRFPQITLSGNAGSVAYAISHLFSPGTNMWLIAGNVLQPVFDGGTLRYKQKAAEEGLNQAMSQYRGTVLTAFQNVADSLRALQADARTLQAAIAAESSAARSIELVQRQIEQGQVSLSVLLSAQQAYLQTSLARVQAEAARLADAVALFQALGGGWWNRWEVVTLPAH
jgi:NodT family efflux transporter outer membrane factor (OMF) lipoprotein